MTSGVPPESSVKHEWLGRDRTNRMKRGSSNTNKNKSQVR
jgi:hypothetical protein